MISIIGAIVCGIVFGAFVWFVLFMTFSITDVNETVGFILPIVIALVVCIAFIGTTCPINTETTIEPATITKMEESVGHHNVTHRHLYAVTEHGEGLCINVNKSEFAILSVDDHIELDVVKTTYLFGHTSIEYDLHDA